MTNNELPLTKILSITLLAAILFTGTLSISPSAFSTGYNHDDDDDDDHDDCDGEYSNHNGDDESEHNGHDHDDDCEPNPCDCKKPDEFTVTYAGPGTEVNPAVVEIYKKTNDIGEKDPIADGITVWSGDNVIVVSASDFGKKKLGSNTAYRILWDDPADSPDAGLVQIAAIDIHTSCSQLLYIGQTFTDGEVTLTVQDGKRNGKTSIPISDPLTCEDDQSPTPMSSITVKKALTNDNDGDAGPEDFTVTFTDIGPDGIVGTTDDIQLEPQTFDAQDASFSVEIPAGTYTLSEVTDASVLASYTTVLIAGDTACPSMVDEPFTMKKETHISCTIYNDDNFVEVQSGGDGIIFHRNSIIFTYMGLNEEVLDEDGNSFDCNAAPCVELPSGASTFILHDMNIDRDTAIVVMNVFPVVTSGNEDAFSDGCRVFRLATDTLDSSKLQFEFQCELIEPPLDPADGMSVGLYRINYAVIDTDLGL